MKGLAGVLLIMFFAVPVYRRLGHLALAAIRRSRAPGIAHQVGDDDIASHLEDGGSNLVKLAPIETEIFGGITDTLHRDDSDSCLHDWNGISSSSFDRLD